MRSPLLLWAGEGFGGCSMIRDRLFALLMVGFVRRVLLVCCICGWLLRGGGVGGRLGLCSRGAGGL